MYFVYGHVLAKVGALLGDPPPTTPTLCEGTMTKGDKDTFCSFLSAMQFLGLIARLLLWIESVSPFSGWDWFRWGPEAP